MTNLRPTWAEVDLSAIRDNICSIRSRVGPSVRVMPAVKANAYGHGAIEVSRACLQAGASALCVATVGRAFNSARPVLANRFWFWAARRRMRSMR
ncbi:MAG: hypothetical protein GX139_12095 [Armatimonadetes bacterium]|nr:hypothetical protein [Armatimonadota bacterium]